MTTLCTLIVLRRVYNDIDSSDSMTNSVCDNTVHAGIATEFMITLCILIV